MKCTAKLTIDMEDGKKFLSFFHAEDYDKLEKKIQSDLSSFTESLKRGKSPKKTSFVRTDEKK